MKSQGERLMRITKRVIKYIGHVETQAVASTQINMSITSITISSILVARTRLPLFLNSCMTKNKDVFWAFNNLSRLVHLHDFEPCVIA